MAFDPTLLRPVVPLGFNSGGNIWHYGRTTEASSVVATVGYFAGCGVGSKGANSFGMRLGDVVIVNTATGATLSTTGKVWVSNVLNSTANVLSTVASSGYSASYDVTISAGSSLG